MAGETGAVTVSRSIAMTMAGFLAIAIYCSIEILISIFITFKRRRGLYFWSMLAATLGIILHTISTFLRFFALAPRFPMSVLICIGWWGMVTGQSVVLYSRLHLVVHDPRSIRWVLYMILFNVCALHVPVSILFMGSNLHQTEYFVGAFNVYERVQLAGFSAQEIVISTLYIWNASRALKPVLATKPRAGRHFMAHLTIVNVLVIVMDATLLACEYSNNFEIQTTYKPVVYGIKLRMEFSVLNRLVCLVTNGDGQPGSPSSLLSERADSGVFVNGKGPQQLPRMTCGSHVLDGESPGASETSAVVSPSWWPSSGSSWSSFVADASAVLSRPAQTHSPSGSSA